MKKTIKYPLVFTLLVNFYAFSQAPPNDECSTAVDLTFGIQVSSSTEMATDSGASSSCGLSSQDVWYKFIAPASGNVYLYLGGGGILNYTVYDDCLGTNEIDCGSAGENLVSSLQPGALYYIKITKMTLACRGDCDYNFSVTVSENVLSQDKFISNLFTYYPNPTEGTLNIDAKTLISKVEVYNAIGNKIMIEYVNCLKAKLDFSNFQAGIYFIKVYTNKNTKTLKIIKNI